MFSSLTRKGRKIKEGKRLCAEISRLEHQLTQRKDFSTLQQLMDVYSVSTKQHAVELYESLKDDTYRKLGERMKQLLLREDIQTLISDLPLKHPDLNPDPLPPSVTLPFSTPKKSAPMSLAARLSLCERAGLSCSPASFDLSDLSWSSSEAELMIDSELCLSARTAERLKGDIQQQDRELTEKLRERRGKRVSLRSEEKCPLRGFADSENCDPQCENSLYEEQFAAIVEKYVLRKFELQADITQKYESQISEIAATGTSGIITKVIQQMRSSQESELKQAVSELETQRKREIALLRRLIFH